MQDKQKYKPKSHAMISKEEGGDLYLCNGSFTKLSDAGAFVESKEKEESTE